MLYKLDCQFEGKGEVKGFTFCRKGESQYGYIYEVRNEGRVHYEVFKKRHVAMCIDFKERVYSDTEKKEVYPKSEDFGYWAWSAFTMQKAQSILNYIDNQELELLGGIIS